MGEPEAPANYPGTRKYRFDLFRYGIGRHVVILGYFAHQEVAHAPPDDVGLVALFLELPDNLGRVRAKLLNLDTMFSKWNDNVFSDNEFLKL
jgi:hypothetical protein